MRQGNFPGNYRKCSAVLQKGLYKTEIVRRQSRGERADRPFENRGCTWYRVRDFHSSGGLILKGRYGSINII